MKIREINTIFWVYLVVVLPQHSLLRPLSSSASQLSSSSSSPFTISGGPLPILHIFRNFNSVCNATGARRNAVVDATSWKRKNQGNDGPYSVCRSKDMHKMRAGAWSRRIKK